MNDLLLLDGQVSEAICICGFSLAETGNLRGQFLLGRTLEIDHLDPF
jgi:hypothetical protein